MSKIRTTVYGTFRGADFSTDPTLVDRSRSPFCTNIIADSGGMPEKRPGWRVLHRANGRVNGLFETNGKKLAHIGTALYSFEDNGTPTELLTGIANHRSHAATLDGTLYIVTGSEYVSTDGTTAAKVTEAYVPTITITRPPAGGGESFENVNLLTPYRKESFQTDGTSTEFVLSGSIDQSGTVKVWIDDVEQLSGYSVDRQNGKITFETAPAAPEVGSADRVVIQYPHTVTGYGDMIRHCTIIDSYGLGGDNRIVLSGNPDYPNRDWISGFREPTYFPDLGFSVLGSEDTEIRGYLGIGSYQAIVKSDNGKEPTIYFRSGSLDDEGEALFTTQAAMSGVGAVGQGGFATLLDDPLFVSSTGVFGVSMSDMSGQRVSQNRSFFVNAKLVKEGLENAEAIAWDGKYLLSFPNGHCYVLDGRQEKSYRSAALGDFIYECYYWENIPAVCWLQSGSDLYFGTADGRICKLNSDDHTVNAFSDDGAAIDAVWASKYDDDGTPAFFKTMLKKGCCVTLKPFTRSSGTVYIRTDKTGGEEMPVAETNANRMDIFDFADIDFERFTFSSDDGPQEIFLNHKIKNYKRLQIIIRNREANEGFGVYQITKNFVVGNFAKGKSKTIESTDGSLATDEQVRLCFKESYEASFGEGSWVE